MTISSNSPVSLSCSLKLVLQNSSSIFTVDHAEIQAKQQPDIIVDFPKTNEACRLLFSRIAVQKSQSPKAALANFLDVLSNAESYRNRIAEQAANALVWNKFYMGTEPESMLPVKEVEALQQIIKEKDEWRAVYIKIIRKTVALVCWLFSCPHRRLTMFDYRICIIFQHPLLGLLRISLCGYLSIFPPSSNPQGTTNHVLVLFSSLSLQKKWRISWT